MGIHANGRQKFLLCFQRAALLFPVIRTPGAVMPKLCVWQHGTIEGEGVRAPFFFLIFTGTPLMPDFAHLPSQAVEPVVWQNKPISENAL
jgi:hypothetical protein